MSNSRSTSKKSRPPTSDPASDMPEAEAPPIPRKSSKRPLSRQIQPEEVDAEPPPVPERSSACPSSSSAQRSSMQADYERLLAARPWLRTMRSEPGMSQAMESSSDVVPGSHYSESVWSDAASFASARSASGQAAPSLSRSREEIQQDMEQRLADEQQYGRNVLIQRDVSVGDFDDFGDYFTATGVLKVETDRAQSDGRLYLIKDWIDRHEFVETLYRAFHDVDWDQFPTPEILLAYEHAKRRANRALEEYKMLLEPARKPAPEEPVTLSSFAGDYADFNQSDDEYEHEITVIDLDDLPTLISVAEFEEVQICRTIIVLATTYHDISRANDLLAPEAAQFLLFIRWLSNSDSPESSPDIVERAKKLGELPIFDRITKEAGMYLTDTIKWCITEYNVLVDKINDKSASTHSQSPTGAKQLISLEDFEAPPAEWFDVCTMEPQAINDLVLYNIKSIYVEQDGEPEICGDCADRQVHEEGPPTVLERFQLGLAFRANFLHRLEGMLEQVNEQVE